jgi:hypothetical protein
MERYANREPEYPIFGERFGSWIFVRPGKGYRWLMQCDCGNSREIRSQDVRQGASTSCGCQSTFGTSGGTANLRHGVDYGSKLYRTWRNAKNRCFNPKATKYPTYGAIGITMCDEWANSYEAFAEAVGEPPSPTHSIDRIDNTKGYEPGNVRWATAKEQSNNTRRTAYLTLNGVTQSRTMWAEQLGVRPNAITYRQKQGMSDEEALTTPFKGKK